MANVAAECVQTNNSQTNNKKLTNARSNLKNRMQHKSSDGA